MPDTDNGTSSNGTLFAGLPWWLRGMAIIGFPAVAALYLTWLVGQALPMRLDAVQVKVDEVKALEIKHHDVFLEKWAGQEDVTKELISISRATCVNAAKTTEAVNRCLGR